MPRSRSLSDLIRENRSSTESPVLQSDSGRSMVQAVKMDIPKTPKSEEKSSTVEDQAALDGALKIFKSWGG